MLIRLPPWALDLALLLLRVMIAAVFGTSGWSHLTHSRERAESIGMSPPATAALGAVEVAGAALILIGLFTQAAAAVLIVVMAGAVGKKLFVWKSGLWGAKGDGWYYDILYLVCNLVILTSGGGRYVIRA